MYRMAQFLGCDPAHGGWLPACRAGNAPWSEDPMGQAGRELVPGVWNDVSVHGGDQDGGGVSAELAALSGAASMTVL